MGAVNMVRHAEVRRRWASILGLMLLVGVIGAVVLSGVAGARRSASALERFEEASRKADVEISVGDVTPEQVDAFRHARGVAAVAELRHLTMYLEKGEVALAGAIDTRFGTVVDRPRIVRGRGADPSAPFEVEVGEHLAAELGIDIGDRLPFVSQTPSQIAEAIATGGFPEPEGPEVRLRVVGIVRRPLDLGLRGAAGGVLVPTPAFVRQYRDQIGSYGSILRVRTTNGAAQLPAVVDSARRIFGRSESFDVLGLAIETEGAQSAIGVVIAAIWAFAGVFALAGIVTVGIVLGRGIGLVADEQPTLRALGLTRPQRVLAAGLPAVPIAVGGAAVAVLGAIALSSRFPIGLARQAEPNAGVSLDGVVLLGGALTVVVLMLSFAAIAALGVTRHVGIDGGRGGKAAGTTITARVTARLGLSPVPTTGARMALESGHGRTAVPVRSAIAGVAVAVVGVVAVLTFASSLDRLIASPVSWGWTWDVVAYDDGADASGGPCEPVDSAIIGDRRVEAVASVCRFSVQLDGLLTQALGFTSMRGHVARTSVVEGREPRRDDEVAVGASTLDALGKRIGDTVRAHGRAGPVMYRIVGTVALPVTGPPQPLADGAVFSGAGLRRLPAGSDVSRFFVANFAPGVDPAAGARNLERMPEVGVERRHATLPVEIDRLRQVDGLPAILTLFLGFLAVVAVGHALVTGVRRRRRDLAILKTLGFRQRQVRATVAWQATTLAAAGVVVGVPLGIVVGRGVWTLVANDLGVGSEVSLPVLAIVGVVAATVILANLVAALPALGAARTRPAVVLRSE